MEYQTYTLTEIREKVIPIAKEYGLKRVYLFGSYARGEATPDSDIDFRIDKGQLNTLFALGGLYNKLCDVLGKMVDVVTTESLDPDFIEHISKEEVLLYDQQLS